MKKETYFFSHDCNARNDERILMLRADHGMEGYGIYWALLEMMFETAETCLSHDKIKGIAVSYNIPITKLQDTIDTCLNEGLFVSNGSMFWSESLVRRKEKYHSTIKKKSEGGKKAMEKRWGKLFETDASNNIDISNLKDGGSEVITSDNKVNNNKEKKSIEKNVFIPPTLDEVIAYIKEKEYCIDAKYFFDYYDSSNWVNNKGEKMVSWQRTASTWNQREIANKQSQGKIDGGYSNKNTSNLGW